jgi:hypothetical protein
MPRPLMLFKVHASGRPGGTSIGAVGFEAYHKGVRENMKLSVETKVGAAIAAGFIALTLGAVAQGNWEGQTGEVNSYGPTNNPKVNTYISQQRYEGSLQPSELIDAIRL